LRPRLYLILLIALTALLASCGFGFKTGPDYERPEEVVELEAPDTFVQAGGDTTPVLPQVRWWEVFGDSTLNRLIEESVDNNLDIRKATASVAEMSAYSRKALSDRLPAVGLNGDFRRQKLPDAQTSQGGTVGGSTDSWNLSLGASYEWDLWGKWSRAHEAARADLAMSIENRATIVQSVISETATLYFQIEATERRIQISEDLIDSYSKSVRTIESRYKRGLTSVLDLTQAQRSLASAESIRPQYRQDLGVLQHRMAVILGRYPESSPPREQPEEYFKRLSPVPAGLPSDLLESRPDVRAAEERLRALNARYGVAIGNLFPQITLTGSYGYTSRELDGLFRPDQILWNLFAGITQPIFNSQTLMTEKDAARARYEQGLTDYAKTVLGAFAEVESALLSRKEQLEKREYILVFLDKARITLAIAESRYDRGLVDYITVLDAWTARFQAEDSLVLVDLAILTNRVTLHRALGGNWIEPDTTEEENR
jgi:multidrug efflux system outer membrane protein